MTGRVVQIGNQTRLRVVDWINAAVVPMVLSDWIEEEERVQHWLVSHSICPVVPTEPFTYCDADGVHQIPNPVMVTAVFRWKDATQ